MARTLAAFTEKTVTDPERIEKELFDIAKRGYASAPEEAMLGINAVATPIFDDHDACVAALAIVGSIQFLPGKPKPADIAALKNASQQISRRLGHGKVREFQSTRHSNASRPR